MYTEIKKIFPQRNVTMTSYFIDNSGEFQQGFRRPMVIVCPGGGYSFLSDREADPIAMKYLAAGFHAAVLRYGINEYAVAPGPLKDIAAAVAYVKSLSDERFVDRDNVFVCGPCWWGTFPMAVFSQLERLDWTGKKVMAVMTHEGSGLGSCERDLQKTCRGASFGKGFSVAGHDAADSESKVAAWAKSQV